MASENPDRHKQWHKSHRPAQCGVNIHKRSIQHRETGLSSNLLHALKKIPFIARCGG